MISVPNVMHASLIAGLLHGNFTYGNKGLLDRKNIRLFTWKEIMSLLRDAGLEVEECKYTVGEESVFTKEAELLTAISNIPNVADEIMFTAYEYLFLLRRK